MIILKGVERRRVQSKVKNKSLFIILSSILLVSSPTGAKAADAYWLDQHNALLYLSTFQPDKEQRR